MSRMSSLVQVSKEKTSDPCCSTMGFEDVVLSEEASEDRHVTPCS